jgi:hypothetical protein
MQITLTITANDYALAKLYTVNPEEHAAGMFEHWAQLARQKHPGLTDERLMALPTLAEEEAQREREQQEAALSAQQRQEAINKLINAQPVALQDEIRSRMSSAPDAQVKSLEEMAQAIEAFSQELQERHAAQQAAKRREMLALLTDPEILAQANAAAAQKTAKAAKAAV